MTVICFDLDGTLVHLTRPYAAILTDVFEDELGASEQSFVDTYNETFWREFDALEPTPYQTGMEAVLAERGDDSSANRETVDALVETLRTYEYDATIVRDATRRSLARLSESNALVVVTNGEPAWQRAKLDHFDLRSVFDAVVTSYDAGAHKPDPAVFELVRERVPGDEYVMVGDDYECDVEGARAAGFVPVHYEDDDGPGFWETLDALA